MVQNQTYHLVINEQQRAFIERALQDVVVDIPSEPEEEIKLLYEMIFDLPQIEAANPGTLHGLCL